MLAVVEDAGGSDSLPTSVSLQLPAGLAVVGTGDAAAALPALTPRDRASVSWEVQDGTEGRYPTRLTYRDATGQTAHPQRAVGEDRGAAAQGLA